MNIKEQLELGIFTPAPARATIQRITKSRVIVAELKLDGMREVLANINGVVTMTGRRDSVKTGMKIDKIGHVPHLRHWMLRLPETVLDGELYYPGANSNQIVSIMGSSSAEAIEKQMERGLLRFVAFDLLVDLGVVMTDLPYLERRSRLCAVCANLNTPLIQPVAVLGQNGDQGVLRDEFIEITYQQAVSQGYEGLILKNVDGPYSHLEWAKVKPTASYDMVIVGYETSTSDTYAGNGIAALRLGLFDYAGKLVEVTRCSGLTDEWRRDFYTDYTAMQHQPPHEPRFVGMVVTVLAQQMFDTGALRHPRFIKLRPEAEPKDQTFAKYHLPLPLR